MYMPKKSTRYGKVHAKETQLGVPMYKLQKIGKVCAYKT